MAAADLSITLGGSLLLFILVALILAGLAFFFYRTTLPPLPRGLQALLSLLRALALLLLLAILFEPIARLLRHSEQPPAIAVLLDDTQSMTVGDSGRGERLQEFLRGPLSSGLPANVAVRYYPFSSKLLGKGSASLPPLAFDGEITNIAEALSELRSQLAEGNIQAALLVTDGNATAGRNPLYDAEALGIPVYTVGVGDTAEQKDIVVESIASNAVAYAGTQTPVEATIRSTGYGGERIEATLMEGTAVVDRATITLQPSVNRYALRMHFVPEGEGTRKLTLAVSHLPGELTERNNVRSLFVKVLRSKLSVLIVAGAPSPDVAAVRQALSEDEHVSLRTYVQRSADRYYEGAFSRTALDSADCVVLIGYPSAAAGSQAVLQLRDDIVRLKKPVLFINGRSTSYEQLQLLEPLLPFTWSGVQGGELLVGLTVAERYRYNTLIALNNKFSAEAWQLLPPVYKSQTSFRGKPEAEILAYAALQNITLDEPLVLLRSVAGRKVFAVTGYGVWRWRLLAQDNLQTEQFFPALLSNVVRWLTTPEETRRVRIAPVKEAFTTGEPAAFSGQVYDEQLRPVDNAEVVVRIDRNGVGVPVALTATGNGLYQGETEGLPEGEYTFTGKATRDGVVLGEDRGRFSVGQINVEFLETKMNKQLLEQIAYRTGASYANLSGGAEITRELSAGRSFTPKETTEASELELWNWKYLAGAVIALFCAEWFVRKRNGML